MIYIGGGTGLWGLAFVITKAPRGGRTKDQEVEQEEKPRTTIWHSALTILRTTEPLRPQTYALLRFIFLSIIAVTFMIAFALTDVQIAPISPFGLVIKTGNINSTSLTGNQWVVNIGGIVADNYSSDVQIPVSVLIFGIAGGYLRFLYYTSTKEREDGVNRGLGFETCC